ncbi:hypothetical protein D3C81_1420470 [compost metagenome]
MKALQPWHQPEGRKGKVGGHLEHFALTAPAGLGNAVIHGLQALVYLFKQQLAGLGELDTPINTVKQARAQLGFQAFHLLAHCRLCRAQLQRRRSKPPQACRSFEHAQGIQRQLGKVLKHKLS